MEQTWGQKRGGLGPLDFFPLIQEAFSLLKNLLDD